MSPVTIFLGWHVKVYHLVVNTVLLLKHAKCELKLDIDSAE